MYGPGDPLPDVYRERFKTALYSERVRSLMEAYDLK